MTSVINNECELGRNSDVAADLPLYRGEHPDVIRVSEATPSIARIDGTECLTAMAAGTEDYRVFPELAFGEMDAKAEIRFPDGEVCDLDSDGGNVDSVAEHVEPEKVRCVEASVSPEIDSRQVVETMVSRASVQTEVQPLCTENFAYDFQETTMEDATTSGGVIPEVSFGETRRDAEATVEAIGSDFDSLYSKVDENYAHELPEAVGAETARALRFGFNIGDMVWGKVKSHPMWPGQIYNDAFASPSVRRTKREDHILVAFFGDSSYGWFDPADLVPFESHYAEKSRQTNSRNFLRAVEEAVDEASRRKALGLSCYCRSPFNFRPTNVKGYFAVNVAGYEPGGVYSVKQIKMARDNFQPAAMLSFVLQMALTPRSSEHKGIYWIKDKATVLAYRKAVYEEYDETYAQAFGYQTSRPSRDSMGVLDQPEKFLFRAPLSGPLVIAESPSERKSSTKPMKGKDQSKKGKDQSKKDKYLLKRREGPNDAKAHHISEGCLGISVPSSFKEGVAPLAAGDFVLQKTESMEPRTPGKVGAEMISGVVSVPSQGRAGQEVAQVDKKPVVANFSSVDSPMNTNRVSELAGFPLLSQPAAVIIDSPVAQGGLEYGKQPLDKEICVVQEVKGKVTVDVVGGPTSDGMHDFDAMVMSEYPVTVHQAFRQEEEAAVDVKHGHVKVGSTVEGLEPLRMRITKPSENHQRLDLVQEGGSGIPCLPSDVKHPAGKVMKMGSDKGIKAKKIPKRPREEPNSEKSIMGERKKKKKKKKEQGSEASLSHQEKHLKAVNGESMRKSAGKSIGIIMDPQGEVDVAKSISPSSSLVTPSVVDIGNIDVDFPQLVDDLFSLALDPFHGVEQNSPAIVRQVFLQFRSTVYQKSLIPLASIEADAEADDQGYKSPAITGAVEVRPGDGENQPSASRPTKQLFTPKDPTKAGRKRSPSDRQEEISSKKLKRLKELKSMAGEKKAELKSMAAEKKAELKSMAAEKKAGNLKTSEMQRDQKDVKDTGVAVSAKPIKPDFVKKLEPSLKAVQPTMLVIKFPPNTTLPSIPQLKARFARFGPLDHSAIRVLWKSSTCRVVFKYKSHAHAAHNYVKNNSLFGSKVLYYLRDVEVPAQELSDTRRDAAADEATQLRVQSTSNSAGEPRQQAAFRTRPPQPGVQLKSCLKKPTGDEAVPILGKSPRVKFMLGGEESSRGEQLVVSSSVNNNGSNADGGGASSLAMDINSKNFQKVVPLPPLLPLPIRNVIWDMNETRSVGQLPNFHHMHHSQVETRNNPNNAVTATATASSSTSTSTSTSTATATTNIDISHQMLCLLRCCSDIVTDVKSSLGYVPYHPL